MSPSLHTLLSCSALLAGPGILTVLRMRSAQRSKVWTGRSPHTNEEVDALPRAVAAAVRQILEQKPLYSETQETVEDGVFTTTTRRNQWVLGTEMTVELRPSGSRTTVAVRVQSQWFERSDAVSTHIEYLLEFMAALRAKLATALV